MEVRSVYEIRFSPARAGRMLSSPAQRLHPRLCGVVVKQSRASATHVLNPRKCGADPTDETRGLIPHLRGQTITS